MSTCTYSYIPEVPILTQSHSTDLAEKCLQNTGNFKMLLVYRHTTWGMNLRRHTLPGSILATSWDLKQVKRIKFHSLFWNFGAQIS